MLQDANVRGNRGPWGRSAAACLAILMLPWVVEAQSGPSISAVATTSVASSSSIITWITNTPSDSQVEYGTSASYDNTTVRDTIPVTSHSMALIGLTPATAYHCRLRSRDAAGNLTISNDFTVVTPATGPGNTYYVDKSNCSDSFAGTSSQPWCTIGHASSVLAPGDTAIVRPGVYNESVTPPSGSATAYITFQGLPGAVLNGNGTSVNGQAFNIGTQSYLIVAGFEVTNYLNPRPAGNAVAVYGTAHHIQLSHLTVHDNWNGIIMSNDANQITINDCLVYNSRYGVGFENTVHDIFISRVTSHSNRETYIGSVSSYGNGDGFSDDFGTYHLFIRDSVAYDNLDAGYDIKAQVFECTNCIAFNNIKYGFRLQDTGGPYTMINSLAYGNGRYALQTQATGAETFLYNSTFISNSNDDGYVMEGPADSLIMRNCILTGYTSQVVSSGGFGALDEDNNLYYSAQGVIGYPLGPHSITANPMFINAAGNDYHLLPISPAIDAGATLSFISTDLDGNSRPQGAGYDIGAYEFTMAKGPGPKPPTSLKITVK